MANLAAEAILVKLGIAKAWLMRMFWWSGGSWVKPSWWESVVLENFAGWKNTDFSRGRRA